MLWSWRGNMLSCSSASSKLIKSAKLWVRHCNQPDLQLQRKSNFLSWRFWQPESNRTFSSLLPSCQAPYPSDCPQTQVKGHVATCTYGSVKAESRELGEEQPWNLTKVPVPHPPKIPKKHISKTDVRVHLATCSKQLFGAKTSSANGSYGIKIHRLI